MAIVLPDAVLSSPSLQYVRDYILSNAKLVAVVSLPYSTFIPHGANVKASVLFLQKLKSQALAKLNASNYPVFMADIEHIGYEGNKNGTITYELDEYGEYIRDENGKKIVRQDISAVLEAWNQYCCKHSAWEK